MTFFDELKRRNVLRMALLYIVSSWLILQVADVLLPNLGAPDWAFRLIFGLLLLGFPLVLVFSWVFDLTPEGLKRESGGGDHSEFTERGRKSNLLIIVLLILAIAIVIADRMIPENADSSRQQEISASSDSAEVDEPAAVDQVPERTIAVMPFADMSPGQDQAYLSDGLAEELLNLLAKVPELRVVSRTSAFSFKGKGLTISELAEQLGVEHILEGSVRKSGDQVRITAQLIDTQTDTHLWSNRWDRELTDVFAIQDEIAQSVVSALKLRLLGETPSIVATDTHAYTLYLQARQLATRGTPQSMLDAIPLYRKSLEIDPEFIPAWLGLGANFSNLASTKDISMGEAYPEIMAAALRILEIDPTNADGHALMAWAEDTTAGNYQAALSHYRQALELDPNNVRARGGLAILYRTLGQIDRAIPMQESLLESDPVNASLHFNLGMSYVAADDLVRAATTFDNALSINPEGLLPRVWRALVDLLNGNPNSSLEQWNQISQDTGSELFLYLGEALALPDLGDEDGAAIALSTLESGWGRPFAYVIATIHAYHSRRDQAFDWLERTLEYHGPAGLTLARNDPMLRPLHEDSRWQPLLENAGLSDAQVTAILTQN